MLIYQHSFLFQNCQNNEVLKGFNDLETTHKHLMNEWDYLNNILLADPTAINEKYQQTVWWICKENSNHRYKLKINEKIKYEKRSLISCSICKGLRRKKEHFDRLKKNWKFLYFSRDSG